MVVKIKLCISSLLFVLFSCTEPQPAKIISEYIYLNESDINIEFITYQDDSESFSLSKGQKFIRKYDAKGVIGHGPFFCDSLEIRSDSFNSKIYRYLDKDDRSPLILESYIKEKVDAYHYKFTYTFTEEDYLNLKE